MWTAAAEPSSYASLEDEEEGNEDLDLVLDASATADVKLDAFSRVLISAQAALDSGAHISGPQLDAAAAAGDAARQACREFTLELNAVQDDIPRASFARLQTRSAEATRRLERLLTTLDFLRATRQRELLLETRTDARRSSELADERAPSDLIALGMKVQLESQQAAARMARMVENAKEVGTATQASLQSQHARLESMRLSVSAQAWQFAEAERELKEFASSALGDNITLALLLLIALALVGLVVYRLSVLPTTAASSTAGAGVWATTVYSAFDPR